MFLFAFCGCLFPTFRRMITLFEIDTLVHFEEERRGGSCRESVRVTSALKCLGRCNGARREEIWIQGDLATNWTFSSEMCDVWRPIRGAGKWGGSTASDLSAGSELGKRSEGSDSWKGNTVSALPSRDRRGWGEKKTRSTRLVVS